ncbi:FxsA family protein [Paralysiella testudinis]|uniref:FxsA family protein n=1 Tax=Paralysiella testudinis TaxID=2809020 RepID=A0A892ZI83_9NEIS|nr:FxsA family protein [Paralysiella testudinis]QRQ82353.1 FxsA family protein [Paralysiella testudinis]
MRFLGWALISLLLLEVLSIVLVADWLGGGITFLLMVAGCVIGSLMIRNIGFAAVMVAGASVRNGQGVSLYQLLWPIRFVVAALLLMSPGFVSDIAALILMLPFKGRPLETADFNTGAQRTQRGQYGDVIEGEYTVSDADPVPPSHTLPQDKRE